jgi:hypothetical protein
LHFCSNLLFSNNVLISLVISNIKLILSYCIIDSSPSIKLDPKSRSISFNGLASKLKGSSQFKGSVKSISSFIDCLIEELNVSSVNTPSFNIFFLNVLDNNLFTLETTKDGNMRCEVLIPSINLECQKRYYKWLEENRLSVKKVKLLTSIIWLNMCPLHEYPLNRFLFHFGKYNLFLNLEEY